MSSNFVVQHDDSLTVFGTAAWVNLGALRSLQLFTQAAFGMPQRNAAHRLNNLLPVPGGSPSSPLGLHHPHFMTHKRLNGSITKSISISRRQTLGPTNLGYLDHSYTPRSYGDYNFELSPRTARGWRRSHP